MGMTLLVAFAAALLFALGTVLQQREAAALPEDEAARHRRRRRVAMMCGGLVVLATAEQRGASVPADRPAGRLAPSPGVG